MDTRFGILLQFCRRKSEVGKRPAFALGLVGASDAGLADYGSRDTYLIEITTRKVNLHFPAFVTLTHLEGPTRYI